MARDVEWLAAFFVAHGNHELHTGAPVPLERLQEFSREDIRFWRGGTALSFDTLLLGATRGLRLLDKGHLVSEKAVRVGDALVPARVLQGPGASLLLTVQRETTNDIFEPVVSHPPRTLITPEDVISFVTSSAHHHTLEERIVWWNDHNLHWSKGGWKAFAASIAAHDVNLLVDDFPMVISHVDVPAVVREAWEQLCEQRANPATGPRFDFYFRDNISEVPPGVSLANARAHLSTAVAAARELARDEQWGEWADHFARVQAQLGRSVGKPMSLFASAGLSKPALQLFAAAHAADVFGGMGSWNDVAPSDKVRYQRVSQHLYASLRPAIEAAINPPS